MANKLKRFLILGSASSTYIANHEHKITEELSGVPAIEELVLDSKEEEIVEILSKAATDISSGLTDPVMLALATSFCIKSSSVKLRQLTHQAIPSICLTSDGLFRLLQFLRKISQGGPNKSGMWGSGMRKALKKWYQKQITEGEEYFATILIREKACHGWSHNDVLKLIHFRAPTPEVDALIKYFAFGKSEALSKLSPALQNLARKAEELKNCSDGARAAALLTDLKIVPYAMPAKFHRSEQVWANYIRNLPLRDVLNRLEFFQTCKKLKSVDLKTRLDNAEPEEMDPCEVLMYLVKYRACHFTAAKSRAIKRKNEETDLKKASGFSDALKKDKKKPAPKKEVAADPTIVALVKGILKSSFNNIPNENRTWTFLMDLVKGDKTKCSYPQDLLVAEVITYSMFYLQCTGQVFFFAKGDVHPCPDLLSEEAKPFAVERKPFDLGLETPFVHPNTDVVVFVCDSKPRILQLEAVMKTLRETMNKPEMRLVIMLPAGYMEHNTDGKKTLIVCGFDERTLRLVNYFGKGGF